MAILDVVVTLSSAGADTGAFTIKDNNNNILATGVTRAQLLAGYRMNMYSQFPTLTVTSTGSCTSSVNGTVSYTAPTYYYYTVSKFDCNNSCAQVGSTGGFSAFSTSQLVAGKHYYDGGYSWRVETTLTPAPSSFDVDLSGLTANDNCTGCQPSGGGGGGFGGGGGGTVTYVCCQPQEGGLCTTYCTESCPVGYIACSGCSGDCAGGGDQQ